MTKHSAKYDENRLSVLTLFSLLFLFLFVICYLLYLRQQAKDNIRKYAKKIYHKTTEPSYLLGPNPTQSTILK
jgi:hypothetical protein